MTTVDQEQTHYYQSGYLFLSFDPAMRIPAMAGGYYPRAQGKGTHLLLNWPAERQW